MSIYDWIFFALLLGCIASTIILYFAVKDLGEMFDMEQRKRMDLHKRVLSLDMKMRDRR